MKLLLRVLAAVLLIAGVVAGPASADSHGGGGLAGSSLEGESIQSGGTQVDGSSAFTSTFLGVLSGDDDDDDDDDSSTTTTGKGGGDDD